MFPNPWDDPASSSTIEDTPPDGCAAVSVERWTVMGPTTVVRRLRSRLRDDQYTLRAIGQLNSQLHGRGEVIPDDWFGYHSDVRDRASDLALDRIVAELVTAAPEERVVIEFRRQAVLDRFRDRHPKFEGDTVVRQRTKFAWAVAHRCLRWGYLTVRALVGLFRSVRLALGPSRRGVLVARSDVYRRTKERWGDPVTASLAAALRRDDRPVVEITYPHVGGVGWTNLWCYLRDGGCLSFEGVFVAAFLLRWLDGPDQYAVEGYWDGEDAPSMYLRAGGIAARWLVRTLNPCHVVVAGEYSRLRKLLVAAARRTGATVAGVQHGVVHSGHPGYTFPGGILSHLKPHVFLAHGAAYTEVLRGVGYNEDTDVVKIGHPYMSFGEASASNRMDARRKGRQVVITSQPNARRELRRALLSSVPDDLASYLRAEVDCVLKLHPNFERPDGFYASRAQEYPFRAFRIEHVDVDLAELLRASDAHVSFTSTCLQEALAMGVPCVELVAPPQEYSFTREFGQFLPEGSVVSAPAEELLVELARLLREQDDPRLTPDSMERCRELFAARLQVADAVRAVTRQPCPRSPDS